MSTLTMITNICLIYAGRKKIIQGKILLTQKTEIKFSWEHNSTPQKRQLIINNTNTQKNKKSFTCSKKNRKQKISQVKCNRKCLNSNYQYNFLKSANSKKQT